jgi:hypothetical protein
MKNLSKKGDCQVTFNSNEDAIKAGLKPGEIYIAGKFHESISGTIIRIPEPFNGSEIHTHYPLAGCVE